MSNIIWWNYLLAGLDFVGLLALLAVGQKKAVGWLWAMLTQAVWIVYATSTFQWGFLAMAVIKLAIYTRNWLKWTREARLEPTERHDDVHPLVPAHGRPPAEAASGPAH